MAGAAPVSSATRCELRRCNAGSIVGVPLGGRWSGVSPEHSVWETIVPETGLDSAPGLVRATTARSGVLSGS
jgi:hypothetical protein